MSLEENIPPNLVETIKHPILGASFDAHSRTRHARLHIVSLSSTAYSCTYIPKPELTLNNETSNWRIFASIESYHGT